jgi:hypothetical protein
MFRVILVCVGLPSDAGEEAAVDIARDFADHRAWHSRVTCEWDGTILTLAVENDFDNTGLATLDEFSDCISAYVKDPGDAEIEIKSVREVDTSK